MRVPLFSVLIGSLFLVSIAEGQSPNRYVGTPVEFSGPIAQRADLSAVGHVHSFLLIGSDEAVGKKKSKKNVVQLLRTDGANRYAVHSTISICAPLDGDGNCEKKTHRREMDIEGIAVEGSTVYVVGSHSAVRKNVYCEPIGGCTLDCKKPRRYDENRKILSQFPGTTRSGKTKKRKKSRDRLVRFRLDPDGVPSKTEEISLRAIIDRLSVFRPFNRVPGKENGVDIEGIAVRDGVIHVGFRGPVLRGNYVPILKMRFEASAVSAKDIVFVKLGGRGIRDLARVSDGFLILAGPVGDGTASYQLYHWDGGDMVPGTGPRPDPPGNLRLLGALTHPPCGRPEGISVQREDAGSYDIIVVFDGVADDIAHRFKITSKRTQNPSR